MNNFMNFTVMNFYKNNNNNKQNNNSINDVKLKELK
jgi:hypothetical protein